ncbi:hypothetical protein BGZ61DRAFT_75805 [Ilyonectria robusta]|uniref:uncharacterized protein n=1 Tax=Ilyonectria robusta TaxID=1079257 RepID=UPI001E8E96A0|nr:uncharacterized protein BGZ61DRAFT_75805 [Ilyonectria robusta]KAH8677172.1 hypothetical protein BGZ61DRAFT_75805 [Ilyonectria robusta]
MGGHAICVIPVVCHRPRLHLRLLCTPAPMLALPLLVTYDDDGGCCTEPVCLSPSPTRSVTSNSHLPKLSGPWSTLHIRLRHHYFGRRFLLHPAHHMPSPASGATCTLRPGPKLDVAALYSVRRRTTRVLRDRGQKGTGKRPKLPTLSVSPARPRLPNLLWCW